MAAHTVPNVWRRGHRSTTAAFGAFGFYVMEFVRTVKHPKPCGHTQYEFNAFGTIPSTRAIPHCRRGHPRLRTSSSALHEALEADCREVTILRMFSDVRTRAIRESSGSFPGRRRPPMPLHRFCFARGRFGSHNTQCWRPGTSNPAILPFPGSRRPPGFSTSRIPPPRGKVAWFVPPHDGDTQQYETVVARHDGKRVR